MIERITQYAEVIGLSAEHGIGFLIGLLAHSMIDILLVGGSLLVGGKAGIAIGKKLHHETHCEEEHVDLTEPRILSTEPVKDEPGRYKIISSNGAVTYVQAIEHIDEV